MNALEQVERLLEKLRVGPKSEETCDQIAILCRGYMEPSDLDAEREIGMVWSLTKSERRIANALLCKMDKLVTKSALLDALTFDHSHDVPEIKIVDIFICKIRQKLEAAQTNYRIETIWGEGYRMVACSKPLQGDVELNGRRPTNTAIARLINKSEQAKAA